MTSPHDAAWLAHEQYVSSGKLSNALLRQPVYRAWERSHDQGASARRAKAIELQPVETERLLDKERDIITAAKPYMRALSKAAGADQHAAMLGDAHAIVLDVVGDEQSVHGPVRVPGPGSLLDEGACGANGIGTPLAEGTYVELVGPEHFIEGFHPFTCQGIPIRDPNGLIVASVSVSVKRPEAGRRLREILICAANGMEMELVRARLQEDIRRIVAAHEPDDRLLENLRQDIVQAHTAARLEVELAARDLGRNRMEYAERLLGLATRSMGAFRRQSALWRDLISTEKSPAESFDLDALVRDIATLLQTEVRTGKLVVEWAKMSQSVWVLADPRETSRKVFRLFLQSFDVARGGGLVRVDVQRMADGMGKASFEAIPAHGAPSGVSTSIQLPLSTSIFEEAFRG